MRKKREFKPVRYHIWAVIEGEDANGNHEDVEGMDYVSKLGTFCTIEAAQAAIDDLDGTLDGDDDPAIHNQSAYGMRDFHCDRG